MKKVCCKPLLILGVLTAATAANASVITVENFFTLQTEDFNSKSLTFPGFLNPGVGAPAGSVLQSVTLTFVPTGTIDTSQHTEMTTSGWLQNTGAAQAKFLNMNVQSNLDISPSDPDFGNMSVIMEAHVFSGTLAAYSGTPCSAASYSCSAGADRVSWSGLTVLADNPTFSSGVPSTTVTSDLSRFDVAGTWAINNIEASGLYAGTFPPTYGTHALTQASVVADVIYTYTTGSVPEPATMGLLASALAGLVMFRKRLGR